MHNNTNNIHNNLNQNDGLRTFLRSFVPFATVVETRQQSTSTEQNIVLIIHNPSTLIQIESYHLYNEQNSQPIWSDQKFHSSVFDSPSTSSIDSNTQPYISTLESNMQNLQDSPLLLPKRKAFKEPKQHMKNIKLTKSQSSQNQEILKPKSSRKKSTDQWFIKPTENSITSKKPNSLILQPIVVVRNRRKTIHFENNTSNESNMLRRAKSQPVSFNTLPKITKDQTRQQVKATTSNENSSKNATSLKTRKPPAKRRTPKEKNKQELKSAYAALEQIMIKIDKLQAKRKEIQEKIKSKLDKKSISGLERCYSGMVGMSTRNTKRSDEPLMPKLTPMPRSYQQPEPLIKKSKIHKISNVKPSDLTESFVDINGSEDIEDNLQLKMISSTVCQVCKGTFENYKIYNKHSLQHQRIIHSLS